jgi:hypothetical protein
MYIRVQPICQWLWSSAVARVPLCVGVPKTEVWTMTHRRCEPTCDSEDADRDGSEIMMPVTRRRWKPGMQGADSDMRGAFVLDCQWPQCQLY